MSTYDDLKPIRDHLETARRAASNFYNLSHVDDSEPVQAAYQAFVSLDDAFSALLHFILERSNNTPHHQSDVVEDDEDTRRIEAQMWATARVLSAMSEDDDEDEAAAAAAAAWDDGDDWDEDDWNAPVYLTDAGRAALEAQQAQPTAPAGTRNSDGAPAGDLWDALASGNYVILDTETTGLRSDAEICEIAIIDQDKKTLLHSLIKPTRPIPADATKIHGITNEAVALCPTFADLRPAIMEALAGRHVVIYNADYDLRLLRQSAHACGLDIMPPTFTAHCAMEAFAEIYGDWSDYHQSYRWQKLSTAVAYYGGTISDAHRALGDCLMTHFVCAAMLKARQEGGPQ